MPNLFIVLIPAYNEEKNIGSVIGGVKKYLERVIVVDDGSIDETDQEARNAGAVVLKHGKNLGKGAALKTGFDYILKNFPDCAAVITLDADGQHDPAEIPKFIDCFEKTGAGLILGERTINRREMPFLRRVGNSAVSWLISRKIGRKISDSQTGFRLFSGRFLKNSNFKSTDYGAETEILFLAAGSGMEIAAIPVLTAYPRRKSVNAAKDAKIVFSIIRELACRRPFSTN